MQDRLLWMYNVYFACHLHSIALCSEAFWGANQSVTQNENESFLISLSLHNLNENKLLNVVEVIIQIMNEPNEQTSKNCVQIQYRLSSSGFFLLRNQMFLAILALKKTGIGVSQVCAQQNSSSDKLQYNTAFVILWVRLHVL